MTLLEYLRDEHVSFAEFAERIGETENIVRKWAYRQRQPSLPNALKVELATGGRVLPRDLALRGALADIAQAG
jgi:DNA-binding transcriptional regulator YdaS (Cro superfamily)